jgi:hypothetical protein
VFVDVLGMRQDVVATRDGIIGRFLAEPGEAVEYGQELARLDPVDSAAKGTSPDDEGVIPVGAPA